MFIVLQLKAHLKWKSHLIAIVSENRKEWQKLFKSTNAKWAEKLNRNMKLSF